MKNRKSKAGILALLGIGAGALAWWKYNNLSPEEKEKLKAKLDDTGSKIKETYTDVEEKLTEKYAQIKEKVKQEMEEVAS